MNISKDQTTHRFTVTLRETVKHIVVHFIATVNKIVKNHPYDFYAPENHAAHCWPQMVAKGTADRLISQIINFYKFLAEYNISIICTIFCDVQNSLIYIYS